MEVATVLMKIGGGVLCVLLALWLAWKLLGLFVLAVATLFEKLGILCGFLNLWSAQAVRFPFDAAEMLVRWLWLWGRQGWREVQAMRKAAEVRQQELDALWAEYEKDPGAWDSFEEFCAFMNADPEEADESLSAMLGGVETVAEAAELLGLPRDLNFTEQQFKTARLELLAALHPDRASPRFTALFQQVNSACTIIEKELGYK